LPQLDLFTFLNQLNHLLIFIFCFYSFLIRKLLPLLAKNLKVRRLIYEDLELPYSLTAKSTLTAATILVEVEQILYFGVQFLPKLLFQILNEHFVELDTQILAVFLPDLFTETS